MHRTLALLMALCLLGVLPLSAARAGGEPWEDEEAFQVLVRSEVKVLRGLLKSAEKKDYRRQAWYLADRLLAIAPADAQAADILDRWSGEDLQVGQVPKKAWIKQRNARLEKLGDDYFHFGETLDASGMDPETYYPINIRAHAYGSHAGPLVTALAQGGYVWLGVYGAKPKKEVETLLGRQMTRFTFPQEYEDEYLKARAVWPEARGARTGIWWLLTDHDYKEALRLLGMLATEEAWIIDHMGSKAGRGDDRPRSVLVFSEWQAYDRVGADLIRPQEKARFAGTSGWYDLRQRRLLVCWRHRDNGYLGDDDLVLGHASKVMARRHFAADAGGRVQGKGYWLLEGLRGAFEGFRLDEDGHGEIDPGSCWRLAVARALRDAKRLIPWDEFMALDQRKGEAFERPTLKISFGGSQREAKRVDIVAAQATALVVGVMKAKRGKALKRLGKLIGDLYKRDSLPDIDKALGLGKGKAVAMAEVAMDAAHGLKTR